MNNHEIIRALKNRERELKQQLEATSLALNAFGAASSVVTTKRTRSTQKESNDLYNRVYNLLRQENHWVSTIEISQALDVKLNGTLHGVLNRLENKHLVISDRSNKTNFYWTIPAAEDKRAINSTTKEDEA